jgi:predicted nucleic acid-binding protein
MGENTFTGIVGEDSREQISRKVKAYLDNCCFNRPYDTKMQARIVFETQAKLYIQEMILKHEIDLVWSYVLKFENSRNIFEAKKIAIAQWEQLSVQFVDKSDAVVSLAKDIMATGVKELDSLHIACAITAGCDYIITVDDRMLKYSDSRIIVCNPIEFINREVRL